MSNSILEQLLSHHPAVFVVHMMQLKQNVRTIEQYIKEQQLDRDEVIAQQEPIIQQLAAETADSATAKTDYLKRSRHTLQGLEALHKERLADEEDSIYQGLYTIVLPLIVELRSRSGGEPKPEIETLLTAVALYHAMSQKGEQVSDETTEAVKKILSLVNYLEELYVNRHTEQTGA